MPPNQVRLRTSIGAFRYGFLSDPIGWPVDASCHSDCLHSPTRSGVTPPSFRLYVLPFDAANQKRHAEVVPYFIALDCRSLEERLQAVLRLVRPGALSATCTWWEWPIMIRFWLTTSRLTTWRIHAVLAEIPLPPKHVRGQSTAISSATCRRNVYASCAWR